jgi:hypothetical protein
MVKLLKSIDASKKRMQPIGGYETSVESWANGGID